MGRPLIKVLVICIVAVSLCVVRITGASEKPAIKVGAIFAVTGTEANLGA
jgi:hypothetical protein